MERSDRKKVTTSLSPDVIQRLKVQAAKEGRNMNEIIEELIEKYLAKVEK